MFNLTRYVCLFFALAFCNEAAQQTALWLATFEQVWTTIRDKHFDPGFGGVDWNALGESTRAAVAQSRDEESARQAISRMLSRLGHSHVGLIPRESFAATALERGSASLGLELRVIDGRPVVWRVHPRGPAAAAGIKPGWVLSTPRPLAASRFPAYLQLQALLQGRVGEETELHFTPGGKVRLAFAQAPGRLATFGNLPPIPVEMDFRRLGDCGYFRLSAFFEPEWLQSNMAQAIASCRDCRGFIVDLRGNPGGIGALSTALASWFLSEPATLGTLSFRGYSLKLVANPRPEAFTGKLAVLIDGLSLSTSEFFAGAIRDLGRGRLFGESSGGMALPSVIEKLPNGDALQYTTASYRSAGGQPLEGLGVQPHVLLPLSHADLLAGRDVPLDAALNWIHQEN